MRKLLLVFVTLLVLGVLAAGAGMVGVYRWASKDLPEVKSLMEYHPPAVSVVYTQDGKVLGNLFSEKRFPANLSEMPAFLPKAFLAAEDSSFYEHDGVSLPSIARAFLKNLLSGSTRQGGSTITQQVIKRVLLTPEKSYTRKLKELILAYRLERYMTKDEILTTYLNQIYLGAKAYGVESAARTYFGVHVGQLTLAQAAMLAGLPQAPTRYSPLRDLEAAKVRQHYVLRRMAELGWITQQEHDAALKEPLVFKSMEESAWGVGAYYLEEVRRWLVERFGEDMVYTGGLKVTTACDLYHQENAEKALKDALLALSKRRGYQGPIESLPPDKWNDFLAHQDIKPEEPANGQWLKALVTGSSKQGLTVKYGQRTGVIAAGSLGWTRGKGPKAGDVVWVSLAPARQAAKPADAKAKTPASPTEELLLQQEPEVQGAMVSMDPVSGEVKACVGGWSFEKSSFNRATQAQRQCGSTFKPIVYSAAIDEGMTPATMVLDAPFVYEDPVTHKIWKPENFGGNFLGAITLHEALMKSRNLVSVRVAQTIGIQKVITRAKDMGIDTDLPPYLPISLGAAAVRPINLCQAYTAFANGGKSVKPRFVLSVTGPDGQTLYQSEPEYHEAMSPQTAYVMTGMLKEVVRAGTAARAASLGKPMGGKTGTTNDSKDAWFIGFTPNLLTGVYLGFDQPQSLGKNETGGSAALPAFIAYRQTVERLYPATDFQQPPGIVFASVDGISMPEKEGQQNLFAGVVGGGEEDSNPNFSDPNAPVVTGEDLMKQMY